jgi:hypothetical protein
VALTPCPRPYCGGVLFPDADGFTCHLCARPLVRPGGPPSRRKTCPKMAGERRKRTVRKLAPRRLDKRCAGAQTALADKKARPHGG